MQHVQEPEEPMLDMDNQTFLHQFAQVLNVNCTFQDNVQDFDNSMHSGLFHFAHACFLLSYLCPNNRYGQVSLHSGLVVGFLVLSTWAWNVICAPDVFAWYFAFTVLNIGQCLYLLYQMRPIRFEADLETIYEDLFAPMSISRVQFKKMCSSQVIASGPSSGHILTLHSGECYAIQDMTRTDRLALCITGRINVLTERTFLHSIHPGEFLDSPEFESSGAKWADSSSTESTFRVTICAAVPSRIMVWPRSLLDHLFLKDPHLATVMTTLISRDITTKLLRMNAKMKTKDGNPMDLRLPGIAGRLKEMDARELASFSAMASYNEEQHRRKATEKQKQHGQRNKVKSLRGQSPLQPISK